MKDILFSSVSSASSSALFGYELGRLAQKETEMGNSQPSADCDYLCHCRAAPVEN